jgi:broad specificity phosphatase PhoE
MLYIRHGHKAYYNDSTRDGGLDPPLTPEGRQEAYEFFTYLVNQSTAPPSRLVVSPFLRARETAAIAQDCLMQRWGNIPLIIDPYIGEYLGRHKSIKDRHFDTETYKHRPIKEKRWSEFMARVKQHYQSCSEPGWYITHGVFIVVLAQLCGHRVSYPDFLGNYLRSVKEVETEEK